MLGHMLNDLAEAIRRWTEKINKGCNTVSDEVKDAAVHRLAKSITQLTLCQVTASEVDDATKLLDKACQFTRLSCTFWSDGIRAAKAVS